MSLTARPTLPEDDDEEEEEEEDDIEPAPIAPKPRQPRKAPMISRTVQSHAQISGSLPPKLRPKSHLERLDHIPVVSPVPSARSEDSSASLNANPFLLKSTGGNVFSDEESRLLFDAYDSIMNLSDDQSIDAWIAWSVAVSLP